MAFEDKPIFPFPLGCYPPGYEFGGIFHILDQLGTVKLVAAVYRTDRYAASGVDLDQPEFETCNGDTVCVAKSVEFFDLQQIKRECKRIKGWFGRQIVYRTGWSQAPVSREVAGKALTELQAATDECLHTKKASTDFLPAYEARRYGDSVAISKRRAGRKLMNLLPTDNSGAHIRSITASFLSANREIDNVLSSNGANDMKASMFVHDESPTKPHKDWYLSSGRNPRYEAAALSLNR